MERKVGANITCKSCFTEDRYITETNDCSVSALQHALDIPYAAAHEELAKIGRRNRKGVLTHSWRKYLDNHEKFSKLTVTHVVRAYSKTTGLRANIKKNMTVARLIDANKDKRMIVLVRGHTFCVDRGTVIDWCPHLKKRVEAAWMIKS